MTVLQVHKYYWHRDGASNYMLMLSDLLQKQGHDVIPFAMKQSKSLPTPHDKFFVSEMKLNDPSAVGLVDKFRYAARMIHSREAAKKMRALLDQEQIDVVHIHNMYHHITPSILPVIKKKGIPVVMTLHDYKLLSPNYSLYHHGKIHEDDAQGWYTRCIANKCMKDSRLQSTVVATEMIWQHKIKKYYERYVDRFICPSEFMRQKCIEHGWPEEKFVHVTNPMHIDPKTVNRKPDSKYVSYIGRLSEEKGVDVLVRAAKLTPKIPYRIVGDGPARSALEQQVRDLGLDNVTFTGFLTGEALEQERAQARIVVVPSVWYENYPLSILEPKAGGKIVIGSKIGGIPELLPEDLLVSPGDPAALARAVEDWYNRPLSELTAVGEELRGEVEKDNNPAAHVAEILSIYDQVSS